MFLILASTVIISRCQFLLFDISQRNDGRKCWNGEKWRGELFWCKKAKAATHMQQTMSHSLHPPALLANPMWNQYWFTDDTTRMTNSTIVPPVSVLFRNKRT